MNELTADTQWDSLLLIIAYGVLICFYLIILKVLLNCIEQLMSKNHRTQRSVIDVQIHQELANHHTDDKTHTFDALSFALNFLKIILIIGGIVGIFIIITLKLNVFFALGIASLAGVIIWQLSIWRKNKGKEVIQRYENIFIQIGGYNVGTLIFFLVALVLVTVGLILLPAK